jgi:hypothetical protein
MYAHNKLSRKTYLVKILVVEQALLPEGWRRDVEVTIGDDGRIASVRIASDTAQTRRGILTPFNAPWQA